MLCVKHLNTQQKDPFQNEERRLRCKKEVNESLEAIYVAPAFLAGSLCSVTILERGDVACGQSFKRINKIIKSFSILTAPVTSRLTQLICMSLSMFTFLAYPNGSFG